MRRIREVHRRYGLLGIPLSGLIAVVVGCAHQGGKATQTTQAARADNGRCYVCHANFENEKLAARHARGGVGCVRCHGPSDAHCADENNTTPPDIMVPPDKINPTCMTCHPREKISRKWVHRPLFKESGGDKKHCTDCHGKHHLAHRTKKWDKTTGKMIALDFTAGDAIQ